MEAELLVDAVLAYQPTPIEEPLACRRSKSEYGLTLWRPRTRIPRAATLDADRRRALVSWARQHDALIIEDDYDAEFATTAFRSGRRRASLRTGSCTSDVPARPCLRRCGLGGSRPPSPGSGAFEREKRFDDMGSALLEQPMCRHAVLLAPPSLQRRDLRGAHRLLAALAHVVDDLPPSAREVRDHIARNALDVGHPVLDSRPLNPPIAR